MVDTSILTTLLSGVDTYVHDDEDGPLGGVNLAAQEGATAASLAALFSSPRKNPYTAAAAIIAGEAAAGIGTTVFVIDFNKARKNPTIHNIVTASADFITVMGDSILVFSAIASQSGSKKGKILAAGADSLGNWLTITGMLINNFPAAVSAGKVIVKYLVQQATTKLQALEDEAVFLGGAELKLATSLFDAIENGLSGLNSLGASQVSSASTAGGATVGSITKIENKLSSLYTLVGGTAESVYENVSGDSVAVSGDNGGTLGSVGTVGSDSSNLWDTFSDSVSGAGKNIYTLDSSDGAISSIKTVIAKGGTFEIFDDDLFAGVNHSYEFKSLSGTLQIDDPADFTGTISGFRIGDILDLMGIGTATSATLGANNVLTVDESGGGSLAIDLAPSQDFSNDAFTTASDGKGGTIVSIGKMQKYVLSALNIPNVTTSSFEDGGQFIYGINDSSSIVGEYTTANYERGGFLYDNNVTVDTTDPNSTEVIGPVAGGLYGINDQGVAVGIYEHAISKSNDNAIYYGYTYFNGNYSTLVDQNAATIYIFQGIGTYADGINNNGVIVGYYYDKNQIDHGFIYQDGNYKDFNYGDGCVLLGINDSDDLIGTTFYDGQVIGFEYDDGKFTKLPFIPTGINNSGVIVGNVIGYGYSDGFIFKNGVTTQYTADGATYTELDGINNNGEIVGAYGSGYPFKAFTLAPAH